MALWGPIQHGNNTAEHYNPLLVYSIHSHPTLCRALVVNLIYWFAQSVPTFLGSTTQPSPIPQVLYSAKPRPYLGLHPCGAVHNRWKEEVVWWFQHWPRKILACRAHKAEMPANAKARTPFRQCTNHVDGGSHAKACTKVARVLFFWAL